MKKLLAAGITACLLAAVLAGIGIYKYQKEQRAVEPEEEITNERTQRIEWRRVDPADFDAGEVQWVKIFSHHEEVEKSEDISLWLYPGEEEVAINGEEFALSEEQGKELRELILQYSHTVKDKEDEYWPDSDEYPDMLVLFQFDVRGGEDNKRYRASGALCYPDGWEEFIGDLKEIIL